MFFGDTQKRRLTAKQFDAEVEQLVKYVQAAVSPFEHDSPEQQRERVDRARADQDYFNQTYLPHYFNQPGAEFHLEIEEMIAEGERQQRPVAIAAPRGHAKSTRITFAYVLKQIVFTQKWFPVLTSDTETQAAGFTVSIRVELEHNPRLLHDFGLQKTKQWSASDFTTRSGIRVMARGDGQGVRGLKNGPHRPDLWIIDDIENDQSVKNPERVKATYQWIMEAVVPSLEPATGVLFIVGTMLAKRSVLARCLSNPAFLTRTYRAISSPAWDEDQKRFTDGLVLWPQRFSLRKLSSIRFLVGSLSFNKEYQNDPRDDDALFKEEWIVKMPVAQIEAGLPAYQGVDPSLKATQSSDYKAETTLLRGMLHGKPKLICRHTWIQKASISAMVRNAYALQARFSAVQVGVELEGWQALLENEFLREAELQHRHLPIVKIAHHGMSKDSLVRIPSLSPLIENGHLIFADGPKAEIGDMELLYEQLFAFPSTTVHDDGPDSLEFAKRLAERVSSGKVLYEGFHDAHRPVAFAQEGAW